jgi:hypothetical protein
MIQGKRRVQRAPKLAVGGKKAHTISDPPGWYGDATSFWQTSLKKRARQTIVAWPTQFQQSQMRWKKTSQLAEWATADRGRKTAKSDKSRSKMETMSGGEVTGAAGVHELPPGATLTFMQWQSVTCTKAAAKKNGWTLAKMKNQLQLRNKLRKRRPTQLTQALTATLQVRKNAKLTVGSKGWVDVAAYLKVVVEAEKRADSEVAAAAAAGASADQAVRRARSRSRHARATATPDANFQY